MINNIKLVYKGLFKNKIVIFYSFILPVILIVLSVVTFTLSVDYNQIFGEDSSTIVLLSPIYILPLMSTVGVFSIGFFATPIIIKEWKECELFSLIDTSLNTKTKFIISFVFLQISNIIIFFFLSFFLGSAIICLIDNSNSEFVLYMISNTNYGELIYALIVYALSVLLIGIVIGYWIKSNLTIQIIGVVMLLLGFIIGGIGIPMQLFYLSGNISEKTGNISINLAILTYFFPFKFSAMQVSEAMTQGYAFNGAGLDKALETATDENGNIDWNSIISALSTADINDFGHSSIFDVYTPYITNIVAIPSSIGTSSFNIWDSVALSTAYWWLLDKKLPGYGAFELASSTMKLLDLIIPWIYIFICIVTLKLTFYRRK